MPVGRLVAVVVLTLGALVGCDPGGAGTAGPCMMLAGSIGGPGGAKRETTSQSFHDYVNTYIDEFDDNDPPSYTEPTAENLKAFRCGFALAQGGKYADALKLLAPFNYELVFLKDTAANSSSVYVLRERKVQLEKDPKGPPRFQFGWGLYAWQKAKSPFVAVEEPHPCKGKDRCSKVGGDFRAAELAVMTFEKAQARFLFITGTDRSVHDWARWENAAFHAVHLETLDPTEPGIAHISPAIYFQPHGFFRGVDNGKSLHPNCKDVVVSSGGEEPTVVGDLAGALVKALTDDTLSDGTNTAYHGNILLFGQHFNAVDNAGKPVADCSGNDTKEQANNQDGLGATTNHQQQSATGHTPKRCFISAETSQNVRNNIDGNPPSPETREVFTQTVADVLTAQPSPPSCPTP